MENSPSFERFKELDLSRDEIDRLGEALKKDEFRKLLIDYVNEVQDPKNQKLYEDEITELERERGNDITFLHPTPCYVIKTTLDGDKKCFINICGNDLVKQPSSSPSEKDGTRGLQWSLPHSLSPPSEDLDNKGERCKVFDVLFHPDTLHLAQKNNAFRNMVNNTACSAIETHFDVELDKNNLRFPKLKYKGMARASVIRKPSSEGPIERSPEEKEFYDKLYAQADESTQSYKVPKKSKRSKSNKNSREPKSPYTTPKFLIKHRRHVEMEEFTQHKESKLNSTIPKELIVEVDLPLLKSADDIILDVTEKTVQLISEKPAKYKLDLTLPYQVGKDAGNAKFDKTLGKLFITLPVQRKTYRRDSAREDSGVDSDHSSPISPESEDENIEKSFTTDNERESKHLVKSDEQFRTKFLEDDVQYCLPEFTSHIFDDTIAFTLHVKNVDSESLKQLIDEDEKSVHVKFVSVSPSFYQVHYAFMLKLPVKSIQKDSVSVEVWDNNVILKVPFANCDNECTWFMFGLSEEELQKKFLEEPHILNAIHKQTASSFSSEKEVTKSENKEKSCDSEGEVPNKATKPQEISNSVQESNNSGSATNYGSYYESSGDELSCSLSPCRSRGILKRSSLRKTFSRSISESSLDDCIGSLDPEGLDIPIPEDNNEHEAEMSTSLKKTVRFNDVVSKQLYRFNSSILGQRKKNQKKAQKKKKAHEKKCSESEASEVEEKKEKFLKPQNNDLSSEKSPKRDENIFQMDM
ncbi:protein kintoun [Coccinella septempunctata]|uniref:protein kintoun n=1 Tax=Coccinella septempunctata TaxID=41139 RepID=UPI001D089915|nr:protein kintoun [Coccinella septempunctata]